MTRLKIALLCIAWVSIGVLVALLYVHMHAQGGSRTGTMNLEKLVISDENGRPRIALGVLPAVEGGGPYLSLLSPDGRVLATLAQRPPNDNGSDSSLLASGTTLTFFDEEGRPRLSLGYERAKVGYEDVADHENTPDTSDPEPFIIMLDRADVVPRVNIGVLSSGLPQLLLDARAESPQIHIKDSRGSAVLRAP